MNRRAEIFSSTGGITLGETAPETLEFFGSMIVLDDPRHSKLRLLVQKGFTPKTVAAIEQSVRTRARSLMAEAADMGACDFVENFAAPLPLQVICDMLGVPAEDEKQIFDWTNIILGAGDPDFGGTFEALFDGALGMYNYAQALGQDRLDHPGEDLVSILMHADVDGQRLTPAEFGSFFILLAVAGNETTRNAISWGMKMLTEHPDQLRDWQADPKGMTPNAIEEIVRWASPVIHMRRTALEDTRIADIEHRRGRQGRHVVLVGQPRRDRCSRTATPSTSAAPTPRSRSATAAVVPTSASARTWPGERSPVMFEEIFRWFPDLQITSEPARLLSPFINGIKRMDCAFTPNKVSLDLDG